MYIESPHRHDPDQGQSNQVSIKASVELGSRVPGTTQIPSEVIKCPGQIIGIVSASQKGGEVPERSRNNGT